MSKTLRDRGVTVMASLGGSQSLLRPAGTTVVVQLPTMAEEAGESPSRKGSDRRGSGAIQQLATAHEHIVSRIQHTINSSVLRTRNH